MKMKIGIDIDDVLAEAMSPLLAFHNKKNGSSLKVENVFSFELNKIFNTKTKEEVLLP